MRWRTALSVAFVATLAGSPAASAQSPVVQAVDGTPEHNFADNRWSPTEVTIRAGETVTWRFAGTTAVHNVASSSSNWDWNNGQPASASPDASHTFPTPGTYDFLCQAHGTSMSGKVLVTDANGNPPPPPPPPPLSEQPFPNDAGAPSAFEVRDAMGPRLRHVVVDPRPHGARVRLRLDEPALVTLRVERARLTVKRSRKLLLKGTRTLKVRGLTRGAYRIVLVASDFAGNRSRVKRARLTVR